MVGHDIAIDKMGAFRLTFRTRAPNTEFVGGFGVSLSHPDIYGST